MFAAILRHDSATDELEVVSAGVGTKVGLVQGMANGTKKLWHI